MVPVYHLSWQEGLNYITAVTPDSVSECWYGLPYPLFPHLKVFQVPIEECSQRIDCTSCTNDLNPLCGWCVVENKCSRQTQCQNSNLTSRWTQYNTNCFIAATVEPIQLALDPTILTNEVRFV